jgi:hypothetical protein
MGSLIGYALTVLHIITTLQGHWHNPINTAIKPAKKILCYPAVWKKINTSPPAMPVINYQSLMQRTENPTTLLQGVIET